MGCAANFDRECSEGINTNDYNIIGQEVMGEKDCSKQSVKEEMKLGLFIDWCNQLVTLYGGTTISVAVLYKSIKAQ